MTRTYTQHLKKLLKLTNNKKPSITINMTSLPSDAALAEQLIVARNEIQNLRYVHKFPSSEAQQLYIKLDFNLL